MNITSITEQYVNEHPSIKDSLKKDLINYSKLSRKIILETELKKGDFDAILIALRRMERKLTKKQSYEKDLKKLLADTKIEIKTKMMVCIIENGYYNNNLLELQKKIRGDREVIHIVDGISATTIITSQEYEKDIKKMFKLRIIKITTGLVEIVLRTKENLEEVPGYIVYLTNLLSEKGINIVETMSCWTDTIFVIEEKNMQRSVEALKF